MTSRKLWKRTSWFYYVCNMASYWSTHYLRINLDGTLNIVVHRYVNPIHNATVLIVDCSGRPNTPRDIPDSKVHVAHLGPTWVLSATGGPNVGPVNLAIRHAQCVHCVMLLLAWRILALGNHMIAQYIFAPVPVWYPCRIQGTLSLRLTSQFNDVLNTHKK